MQFPIFVGLHRSRILDAAILAIGLIAGLLFWAWPRSTGNFAQISTLVALLAMLAWIGNTPRISGLRLARDGKISLQSGTDPAYRDAHLLNGATVHPWLTVFRLQDAENGRTYRLVVVADSADAASIRRLRMFLRWQARFSDGRRDA